MVLYAISAFPVMLFSIVLAEIRSPEQIVVLFRYETFDPFGKNPRVGHSESGAKSP